MRRRFIIVLLLAVAWSLAAPAQSAAKDILRIEDQWLRAKTSAEAAQFLAPDFVGVSTQGMIETREQRLARFRPAPQPPATAVHFEHLSVAFPTHDVAIATGQVIATVAMTGASMSSPSVIHFLIATAAGSRCTRRRR